MLLREPSEASGPISQDLFTMPHTFTTVGRENVPSPEGEFHHDYTTGDFAYPDGRDIVKLGPDKTVLVRMSDVHELPQIRETYDEQAIEELAHQIIKDNNALARAQTPDEISAALDLMHPPELNLLQPDELEKLLEEHARYYELETPIAILHGGRPQLVRDFGHRRGRAIEYIVVKMKGLTLDDVAIRSVILHGLSFDEMNQRQSKENSGVNPSPIDDAKNIRRRYNHLMRKTGQRPRVTEIARFYGMSETKVRTALAFISLPEVVQAFAGNEKGEEQLSFSMVASLAALRDLYESRYDSRVDPASEVSSLESRDESISVEIEAFTAKLANGKKDGQSSSHLYKRIAGEKKSVEKSIERTSLFDADNLMLFEAVRVKPTEQRTEAYRRYGKNCLYGISLAAASGALEESQIQELERLAALARSLARPSEPDMQEAMF